MANSTNRLAAIDLGTNSFHMIVADLDPAGVDFKIIDREKDYVRIGSGDKDMKYLTPSAIERAMFTMMRFKDLAGGLKAKIRAVATSAIREALNQEEFRLRVKRETGIEIEIISGFEEIRLIYVGTLKALPIFGKSVLLVHIGGGSTDFLLAKKEDIIYDNTLKIGALRLTQSFFPGGEITEAMVKQCRKCIRGTLYPVARRLKNNRYEIAVGTSGTIECVASIIRARRRLPSDYQLNNFTFTRKELEGVLEEILAARDLKTRTRINGIDPARADIIVAGVLILAQVLQDLDLDSITVSEYGLREGVVIDTMSRQHRGHHCFEDIKRKSVAALAQRFHNDQQHANHTAMLALLIFDQTDRIHGLGEIEREFLEVAALLHDIGFYISYAQHHRHSYYLIRNSTLLGFTEDEKEIIANIARYHRKSHPKQKHENFSRLEAHAQSMIRMLAAILRLADGLDRSHTGAVSGVQCRVSKKRISLLLESRCDSDLSLEIWGAVRKKRLFEETFGYDVRIDAMRPNAGVE